LKVFRKFFEIWKVSSSQHLQKILNTRKEWMWHRNREPSNYWWKWI